MEPTASVLLNRLLARGKFRHVQVILQLAELGSVQRTADALGMTQSAVTQTLAYVENLLETPLFLRHARGVRPTSVCADFLPVARQLLTGMAQGAEVVTASRTRSRHSVRVLASSSANNGMLVQLLTAFHARHPDAQIHLAEAEGEDQLLAVARGEVDVVACRQPAVVPEGWSFRPLVDDRYVAVCAPGHPLARRRKLRPADLAAHVWLMSPVGTAARARFDRLVAEFPTPPPTYPLVTRVLAPMRRVLRDEPVIAFIPWSFVRHLVDDGELVQLPIAGDLAMAPLGLLTPVAGGGAASRQFVEFVSAAAKARAR